MATVGCDLNVFMPLAVIGEQCNIQFNLDSLLSIQLFMEDAHVYIG